MDEKTIVNKLEINKKIEEKETKERESKEMESYDIHHFPVTCGDEDCAICSIDARRRILRTYLRKKGKWK